MDFDDIDSLLDLEEGFGVGEDANEKGRFLGLSYLTLFSTMHVNVP
jgi:hypothetical protein